MDKYLFFFYNILFCWNQTYLPYEISGNSPLFIEQENLTEAEGRNSHSYKPEQNIYTDIKRGGGWYPL